MVCCLSLVTVCRLAITLLVCPGFVREVFCCLVLVMVCSLAILFVDLGYGLLFLFMFVLVTVCLFSVFALVCSLCSVFCSPYVGEVKNVIVLIILCSLFVSHHTGTKRFDSEKAGDREVQRTMLELLNQMDGFQSNSMIKVTALTAFSPLSAQ